MTGKATNKNASPANVNKESTVKPKKLSAAEKLQQMALANLQDQAESLREADPTSTDRFIQECLQKSQNAEPGLEVKPVEEQGSLEIPVELIDACRFQPRRTFNPKTLQELADSIDAQGQIEPIVVRPIEGGRFEIIAGERRLRAIRDILGKPTIQVIVQHASDRKVLVMAIVENLQRDDLSDYEVGMAIINGEHEYPSVTAFAEAIGKPRAEIYRWLAFAALPRWIRSRLDANPCLISRNNALELKNLLAIPENEQKYKDHILKVMDAVESNAVTQDLFMDRVKRLARESTPNYTGPTVDPSRFVKKQYLVDGKKIGNFKFNEKGLAISIQHDSIGDGDLDAIYDFIQQRLAKGEGA